MTTYTEEEKEMALKVYKWVQDRIFMERYGSRLKRSRYTILMRIYKESGTYTFIKGGAYYFFFRLRDIGFNPSYETCRVFFILTLTLPPVFIAAALAFYLLF